MRYLENTNTGTCPAVIHKTRLPPQIPKVRWRQSVKRIITIEGFKSGWGHDRQEQGSQPPAGAKKIPGDVNTEYRDQLGISNRRQTIRRAWCVWQAAVRTQAWQRENMVNTCREMPSLSFRKEVRDFTKHDKISGTIVCPLKSWRVWVSF